MNEEITAEQRNVRPRTISIVIKFVFTRFWHIKYYGDSFLHRSAGPETVHLCFAMKTMVHVFGNKKAEEEAFSRYSLRAHHMNI